MKYAVAVMIWMLIALPCDAGDDCLDTSSAQCADDATSVAALPEDALAQVNELKVKMRYFKAIGFHKQSEEKRDEIAAIYEQYGVPLPEEYQEK